MSCNCHPFLQLQLLWECWNFLQISADTEKDSEEFIGKHWSEKLIMKPVCWGTQRKSSCSLNTERVSNMSTWALHTGIWPIYIGNNATLSSQKATVRLSFKSRSQFFFPSNRFICSSSSSIHLMSHDVHWIVWVMGAKGHPAAAMWMWERKEAS